MFTVTIAERRQLIVQVWDPAGSWCWLPIVNKCLSLFTPVQTAASVSKAILTNKNSQVQHPI